MSEFFVSVIFVQNQRELKKSYLCRFNAKQRFSIKSNISDIKFNILIFIRFQATHICFFKFDAVGLSCSSYFFIDLKPSFYLFVWEEPKFGKKAEKICGDRKKESIKLSLFFDVSCESYN
eukprot:GHVP01033209.1.p1 GENE.GHVP01033209.1~~GHVP01033209.1.p1  ORF type:complete len:120 (-),score=12.24 GHVP01033209.1:117-476(-)